MFKFVETLNVFIHKNHSDLLTLSETEGRERFSYIQISCENVGLNVSMGGACVITALGTPRATSVSLHYVVSGESRVSYDWYNQIG